MPVKQLFVSLTVSTLLAGCATTSPPVVTAVSPASPEAPEGARVARESSLSPDATTRKSNALLSAAQKEQTYWDDYGPVSGTPEDAPKADGNTDMRNMKHEH